MKTTVGLFTLAVAISCLLQKGRAQGVIEIQPDEGNITLAEGNEFRRLCIAHTSVVVTFQWMHNGLVIKSQMGPNLQILLPSIVASDAGEYFCQIVFPNGTTVGPVSGGVLTVIGINVVDAPLDQYAIIGTNYTLECSIPYDSVFISWMRNGGYSTGVIANAAFSDEGTYTCSIFLLEFNLPLEKDVQLHIFVPVITVPESSSPTYREIEGNPAHQITVAFQGRSDTIVTWYKDGTELEQDDFETEFPSEEEGTTYISFDPVTRSDMGVYRVTLESPLEDDVIATELRRAEATFQIDVIVPPVKPTDLEVDTPLGTHAQITWSLANQIADEAADSLTLTLESNDIPIFQEYTLPGSQTAIDVDVVPGLQYTLRLSSHNVDGTTFADPLTFDTPPMPPLVIQDSIEIVRVNRTAFHLNLSLNHTGGGNVVITALYWERGTIEWLSVDSLTLTSVSADLTSYEVVLVIKNLLDNGPLEFEITLTNARELVMTADVVGETLVLPGAPTDIILLSSTTDALNIEVQLSPEGTPPITEVRLELTSPRISANTFSETGIFLPGDAIEFVIKDLQNGTDYSFVAYSVNFAGIGPMSEEKSFQTAAPSVDESENEESDSFFLIIVVVAICGTVVILAVVVALVCCMVLCFKHHHKKHRYPISGKKPQPQNSIGRNRLNSSNEMLNRLDKDIAKADVVMKIKAQDSPSSLRQNGIISHTDLTTGQNTPTTEDSPSNVKHRMEANGSSSTILLPANEMESQRGSTSRMPCMLPSHRSSIISSTGSNVYAPCPTKHASISTTTTELPFSPNYGEPMDSADVYPLGPFHPRGSIGASSQSNTSVPPVAPFIHRGSRSDAPILPTHSSQHLLLNHSHRGSIESTPMMMYRMEHQGSISSMSNSTASSRERIQRPVMTSVPRETQSLQSLAHRSGYNSINSTLECIPQVPPNLSSSQYASDV